MRPQRYSPARRSIEELLAKAGIGCAGERRWDVQVHDGRFYERVMAEGSLGLGDAYMDGWWDCEALDEMFYRVIRAGLAERTVGGGRMVWALVVSRLVNVQDRRGARRVGEEHYDLGNDFFEAMLDPWMQYSCGYFRGTDDLAEAQRGKLELICRKLGLREGMRVLDIGCGWGGLARYVAERHGCEVVGITISREQQVYAEAACRGLPVEIRLEDYRDVREEFDRIVSVGMLEHVGSRNYGTYMEMAGRCLREEGLFLCHTIAGNAVSVCTDAWIAKHIFPNSQLPAASQVARAAEGVFVLEDVHNFGADYDRTLMAWEGRFGVSWGRFAERYGERFRRMWRYYLLSCAGAFRARGMQLYQFLFSRGGMEGGCPPVR